MWFRSITWFAKFRRLMPFLCYQSSCLVRLILTHIHTFSYVRVQLSQCPISRIQITELYCFCFNEWCNNNVRFLITKWLRRAFAIALAHSQVVGFQSFNTWTLSVSVLSLCASFFYSFSQVQNGSHFRPPLVLSTDKMYKTARKS